MTIIERCYAKTDQPTIHEKNRKVVIKEINKKETSRSFSMWVDRLLHNAVQFEFEFDTPTLRKTARAHHRTMK
jgi:hypothetical protein